MLRMRILSEFKAEGWLPRKFGFHSPVALMPLAFNSHSLRKHFSLPLCFIPNLPRYKQWKRWSPLSTAAQDCLSSLVSQFFLPFNDFGNILLSTACFPPLLPAWRAGWTRGGDKAGRAVLVPRLAAPHHAAEVLLVGSKAGQHPSKCRLSLAVHPPHKIHAAGARKGIKGRAECRGELWASCTSALGNFRRPQVFTAWVTRT